MDASAETKAFLNWPILFVMSLIHFRHVLIITSCNLIENPETLYKN